MTRFMALCAIVLGLGACGIGEGSGGGGAEGGGLDEAAIAAGVIVDADALDLAGLYERDSGLGTDRFCAIKQDSAAYKVGILAVFGASSQCEATGEAVLDQGNVRLSLRAVGEDAAAGNGCELEARFDGTKIQIAGNVGKACEILCSPRASLAGVSIPLIDASPVAGKGAEGRNIDALCD